jgi:hypothetical protein
LIAFTFSLIRLGSMGFVNCYRENGRKKHRKEMLKTRKKIVSKDDNGMGHRILWKKKPFSTHCSIVKWEKWRLYINIRGFSSFFHSIKNKWAKVSFTILFSHQTQTQTHIHIGIIKYVLFLQHEKFVFFSTLIIKKKI